MKAARALGEQVPPRELFEFVPPLERPANQGDVVRVLVVRPADDPGVPVRAAPVVDEGELFQREHRPPAARL